jgi:hypothetical protein
MRCFPVICLLTVVACASSGPRGSAREFALRRGSALEFALAQVAGGGRTIIIAADESVAEVRRLLPHRRVMTTAQFVKDHPPDAHNVVPASVFVGVPEFEGNTVHVQVRIPGVLPPTPPNVPWCGEAYDFILERDGEGWRIVKRWETVC